MYSLLQLVTNEWIKITKKKSFIIGLSIVSVLFFVVAFFISRVMKEQALSQLEFMEMMIAFNGGGILYLILTVLVSSSIVASEHQLGTIKLLLIRSHTRTKILLSKLLAVMLYMVVLALFYIVVSFIAGFIFLNASGDAVFIDVLKTVGLTALYTLTYTVIAFMLSTLLRSSSGTIALTFSLMFIESLVTMLINRYDIAKYYLFNHVDFSVYLDGGEHYIDGVTLPFSIVLYIAYLLLFLVTTFVVFKRKDVA